MGILSSRNALLALCAVIILLQGLYISQSQIRGATQGRNIITRNNDPQEVSSSSSMMLRKGWEGGNESSNVTQRMETVVSAALSSVQLEQQAMATTDGRDAFATTNDDAGNFAVTGHAQQRQLPSCRTVMQTQSHWADGEFLTRPSMSHQWIPRHDGSQRLELNGCQLHRYTRKEALQCLDGTHINFIGDSLTRYQYVSLAYFIEKGTYPPGWGRHGPCVHFNRHGEPVCSPRDEPNVCMEGDWSGPPKELGDSWAWLHGDYGGGSDGGTFGGRMECSCARARTMKCKDGLPYGDCTVENELFVSDAASPYGRVIISNVKEDGWGGFPRDFFGFNFTGCSFDASCRFPLEKFQNHVARAQDMDFDWKQNMSTAIAEGGVLRQQLPPVTFTFYNRGLWGTLTDQQAKERFPLLKQFASDRCFYKTTTGSPRTNGIRPKELGMVKTAAYGAGCEIFDVGHLTNEFVELVEASPSTERKSVYWDAVHFQPWVYEEINNVLLNVLCNTKPHAKDG